MFIEKEVQNLRWYPQRNSTICSHAFTFVNEFDICYFRITISTFELGQSYITDLMCMSSPLPTSIVYLGIFNSLGDAMENAENYYQLRLKGK